MSENRRFGVTTAEDEDLWFYVGRYLLYVETGTNGEIWQQITLPLIQGKHLLEAVLERIEEQENDG